MPEGCRTLFHYRTLAAAGPSPLSRIFALPDLSPAAQSPRRADVCQPPAHRSRRTEHPAAARQRSQRGPLSTSCRCRYSQQNVTSVGTKNTGRPSGRFLLPVRLIIHNNWQPAVLQGTIRMKLALRPPLLLPGGELPPVTSRTPSVPGPMFFCNTLPRLKTVTDFLDLFSGSGLHPFTVPPPGRGFQSCTLPASPIASFPALSRVACPC